MAETALTLGRIAAVRALDMRWAELLEALAEDAEAFDRGRVVSIGDVVLACGEMSAMLCLHLLPPRARVSGVMRAVRRALKHSDNAQAHELAGAVEAWLAGGRLEIAGEVTEANRTARTLAVGRAWAVWAAHLEPAAHANWARTRAAAWAEEALELAVRTGVTDPPPAHLAPLALAAACTAHRMALAAARIEAVAVSEAEEGFEGDWPAQRADLLELYPPVALAHRLERAPA
ncbi:hypothetical protein [Rhodobacteraceae bacterium DSL-40]|uniref:hypothetical protein n=1 Tax=Amaricoccus sp. B4 TaxID=3368557 RepID=UPI000DACBB87